MALPAVLASTASDAGPRSKNDIGSGRRPVYPGVLAALFNASCSRTRKASLGQPPKDQDRDVHPPILKLVRDCIWLGYNGLLSQRKPLVAEIVSR